MKEGYGVEIMTEDKQMQMNDSYNNSFILLKDEEKSEIKYKGFFKNSKRHGYGVIFYTEGGMF
jgi:hypothetical protein